MNIFHVAPVIFGPPSGLSVYVVSLLNAVAKIGNVRVGLLSTIPGEPGLKDLDKRIFRLPALTREFRNPWAVGTRHLSAILDSFGRPDLVHFHGVYFPFQSALAFQLREQKMPYIVSIHGGLQPHSQRRKAWKKFLGNLFFFNRFINGALAIHALNHSEKEAVKERFPGKQTFIMSNGVPDSMAFLVRPERSSAAMGGLTVGFIGRMDMDHKGIDLLLKAVYELQRKGTQAQFRFIFAGPFHSPEDERSFRRLVNGLPVSAAVEYKGVVSGEEKDKAFDLMDIFVHTSRHEGMPGAVLEAMARGIPCLVTPGTNMQKIISECSGGWCCDATPGSIARVLIEIIEKRHEIPQRGLNSRNYVLANLTWDKIAEQYIQNVRQLIHV